MIGSGETKKKQAELRAIDQLIVLKQNDSKRNEGDGVLSRGK
jgi:hypothetical protein